MDIREKISKILVSWGLGTRQSAINELVKLVEEEKITQLEKYASWIHKESLKSAMKGIMGYDFVHRLEGKIREDLFKLASTKK